MPAEPPPTAQPEPAQPTPEDIAREKAQEAQRIEEEQIARLRRLALEADLDPEFSEKFLRFIIDEVIRHHARAQSPG